MKRNLHLFFLASIFFCSAFISSNIFGADVPSKLYFDFEGDVSTNPVFNETSSTFEGVIENPAKDAANSSDSVGLCRTSSVDWDGIQLRFETALDLTEDTIFTMLVYHPDSAGSIRLQFDGTGMSSLKLNVPYSNPGNWELLTWNIPSSYDGKINRVLLVFDHNNGQAGGADGADVEDWYFDELRGPKLYPLLGEYLYFDFEGDTNPTIGESTVEFLGVVENPSKDGLNISDSVGLARTSDTDWDGLKYEFQQPIDLSGDTVFTMLVYHPDSTGSIRLQFDGNGMSSLKLNEPYDTPGSWQILTWRVPSQYDDLITRVLLVFDHNNGQAGGADGADVEDWYFDELRGAPENPEPDFTPPKTYYSTTNLRKEWTGFDGVVFEGIVDNPSKDDVNDGDYAAKALTGSNGWSGMYYDLPAPIDLSETDIFMMMVYSDSSGYVRIQLEGDGSTAKLSVPYDTPGEWKKLTFSSSDNVGDPMVDDVFDRIVLIFDDKDADVEEEWYFDNVLGPNIGDVDPLYTFFDYETPETSPDMVAPSWGSVVYGGTVANPSKDAVNESDSVGLQITGNVGWHYQEWLLDRTIDFSEGTTFTMKVFNADSTGFARIQLDDASGLNLKMSVEYTTPGEWQELTFSPYDLYQPSTGEVTDDSYIKVKLIFDDRDGDIEEYWYYDDMKGPGLTPVYYVDVLFTVTIADTVAATDFQIELNNDGTMVQMYNDSTHGDTMADDSVWTVLVAGLPVGDYVYDIYADGSLIGNGDDIAFDVPMYGNTYPVDYYYVGVETGIDDIKRKEDIKVYPNPATDKLVIENSNEITSIKVYNIVGSEVMNIHDIYSKKYTIHTSGLFKGYYIVSATDKFGKSKIIRFIKQ